MCVRGLPIKKYGNKSVVILSRFHPDSGTRNSSTLEGVFRPPTHKSDTKARVKTRMFNLDPRSVEEAFNVDLEINLWISFRFVYFRKGA